MSDVTSSAAARPSPAGATSSSAAAPPSNGSSPPIPKRALHAEFVQTFLLYALSVALLSLIFQPLAWWPFAFVGLVPWAIGTCRVNRAWVAHWLTLVAATTFFAINVSWLRYVTDLGFMAMAAYLAVYWNLAAWAIRTARRRGIPLWLALPTVWVACEYLRAFVMTGFPWLFIAHSFATVLPMIQISDLTGAYGVTFVVVLVSGALAEWGLVRERLSKVRTAIIGSAVALIVTAATLGYGQYQLAAAEFTEGPRVAVIQEDFPLNPSPPYSDKTSFEMIASYLRIAAEAIQWGQPDLVAMPETAWNSSQNRAFVNRPISEVPQELRGIWEFSRRCDALLRDFARGAYQAVDARLAEMERFWVNVPELDRMPAPGGRPVTVIVGTKAIERDVEAIIPQDRSFNSAVLYDPSGVQRETRYDKIHLVPFGEAVPFRDTQLHWLYRWLNSLSPFSSGGTVDYSLTPGTEYTRFELEKDGRTYRFAIPICYEDTTPYVPRNFVWENGEKQVDFLVNISNDGWFVYSAELSQHFAISTFRAVENRVTMMRAVNTGVSGAIDPNGRIIEVVTSDTGKTVEPGVRGYVVVAVPIDARISFYGLFGDWFPRLCLAAALLLWAEGVMSRWIRGIRLRLQRRSARRRAARDAAVSHES